MSLQSKKEMGSLLIDDILSTVDVVKKFTMDSSKELYEQVKSKKAVYTKIRT